MPDLVTRDISVDIFPRHRLRFRSIPVPVRAHPGLVGTARRGRARQVGRGPDVRRKSDVFALDDVIIAVQLHAHLQRRSNERRKDMPVAGLAGYYSLIRVDENHVLHNLIIAAECDREGISGDAR